MALSLPHFYGQRVSKSNRAGLIFPVSRMHRYLKNGRYSDIVQKGAAVYLAGVIEYLVMEIIELGGDAARDNQKVRITPRHIKLAVTNDDELNRLMGNAIYSTGGVRPFIHQALLPDPNKDKKKKKKQLEVSLVTRTSTSTSTSTSARGKSSTARKSVGSKTPVPATQATRRSVGAKTVPGQSNSQRVPVPGQPSSQAVSGQPSSQAIHGQPSSQMVARQNNAGSANQDESLPV